MNFLEMMEFTKRYPLGQDYIIHLEDNNVLVKKLAAYRESVKGSCVLEFIFEKQGNDIVMLTNIPPLVVTPNE